MARVRQRHRDAVIFRLRRAHQRGLLDNDEYQDRLDTALTITDRVELLDLVADLAGTPPKAVEAAEFRPPPTEATPTRAEVARLSRRARRMRSDTGPYAWLTVLGLVFVVLAIPAGALALIFAITQSFDLHPVLPMVLLAAWLVGIRFVLPPAIRPLGKRLRDRRRHRGRVLQRQARRARARLAATPQDDYSAGHSATEPTPAPPRDSHRADDRAQP